MRPFRSDLPELPDDLLHVAVAAEGLPGGRPLALAVDGDDGLELEGVGQEAFHPAETAAADHVPDAGDVDEDRGSSRPIPRRAP